MTVAEFNRLRERDYLAGLMAAGRYETIGHTQRTGRCSLCGGRDRAVFVDVVLHERCGDGTMRRRVSIHRRCDRDICRAAAQKAGGIS